MVGSDTAERGGRLPFSKVFFSKENCAFEGECAFSATWSEPHIVGESPAMKDILGVADKIAPSASSVLITGERGTGKKRLSDYLFMKGSRCAFPFVRLDCAHFFSRLPEESFFSLIQSAQGGTVLLESVDRLPFVYQERLNRVCGDSSIGVRFISTASPFLEEAVRNGAFNEDLYYSLSAVSLSVPPLRHRVEDIEPLMRLFLAYYGSGNFAGFSEEALDAARFYAWPGNVEELRICVERASVVSSGSLIQKRALCFLLQGAELYGEEENVNFREALRSFKKRHIESVLAKTYGNQTLAAKKLGLQRTYLSKLITELGIKQNASS